MQTSRRDLFSKSAKIALGTAIFNACSPEKSNSFVPAALDIDNRKNTENPLKTKNQVSDINSLNISDRKSVV